MRCFGSKRGNGSCRRHCSADGDHSAASGGSRKEKRHSVQYSMEQWRSVNGNGGNAGGGKKLKKRRRTSADPQQKQRKETPTTLTKMNGRITCGGGEETANGAAGSIVEELEFTKITERIFALLCPSGSDAVYRQNIKQISERIKQTFPDRYKIFNLSQKRSDLGRSSQQGAVLELGWPDTLAPPLDRLCSICKQIENHLNASAEHVAIVHCKGGLYRAGIVIAAFMHYTNICAGDEALPDRFSMQLFTQRYLADAQPSHKRYVVKYFANLLSGAIRVYPTPVFLAQIQLDRLFPGRLVTLKVYERMKPVWSSGKLTLSEHSLLDLCGGCGGGRLSLRGDVLLKCYEPNGSQQQEKQLLFQCQFNTCAIGLDCMAIPPKLTLHKEELDCVFNDKAVDNRASLALWFELAQQQGEQPPTTVRAAAGMDTPRRGKSTSPARLVGTGASAAGGGDFLRADSYENFNERAEDDRSLSLPTASSAVVVANGQLLHVEDNSSCNNHGRLLLVNPAATAAANEKRGGNKEQQYSQQYSSNPSAESEQQLRQPVPQQRQQHTPSATDGADSGIGSDSPKAAAATAAAANAANGSSALLNGTGQYQIGTSTFLREPQQNKTLDEEEFEREAKDERSVEGTKQSQKARKMPPPVPPKTRRNSSTDPMEEEHMVNGEQQQQRHEQQEDYDNDPMRGAYEDSAIGRDHSVLPPGARRPKSANFGGRRRLSGSHAAAAASTATADAATSASSGDERPPPRRVVISPMVQPELVTTGRYDPNSRCFSYVPVKSLKEHYTSPKKPALKRRTSVVEPVDLDSSAAAVSPLEAKFAMQNFGLQSSSGDLRRRAETPKWEMEIEKMAPTTTAEPFPERRTRRASTSGIPAGHIQRDYVRSPSSQVRSPQEEWRKRRQRRTPPREWWLPNGGGQVLQQQHRGGREWPSSPAEEMWTPADSSRRDVMMPSSRGGGGWEQQPSSGRRHWEERQQPQPERPVMLEQAKRATPVPAALRYSSSSPAPPVATLAATVPSSTTSSNIRRAGRAIPGVRPSHHQRRQEMDQLCDPDFYLSYCTPTSSPVPERRQQKLKTMAQMTAAAEGGGGGVQQRQPKQHKLQQEKRRPLTGDLLSKSVPNDRAFRLIAENEMMRPEVRDLLAEHLMSTPAAGHRSSQHIPRSVWTKQLPSHLEDHYRSRNCRSVNSTPIIGNRRLFAPHFDLNEPATDPEERCDEHWLNSKLAALKTRRYMDPMAQQRRNAEKLLLEELKSKAVKMATDKPIGGGGAAGGSEGGDPVREFRREQERLKNTQSPLLMGDGLRLANRDLQRERARQQFFGSMGANSIGGYYSGGEQSAQQQPPRSLSATPGGLGDGHQQQQMSAAAAFGRPLLTESPVPQQQQPPFRRGATPTSQIVRGKPPTPPPIRSAADRERSRSPYSAKLLRGSSSSAPPITAAAAALGKKRSQQQLLESEEEQGGQRREEGGAVNPNLLALRQSLYAKERERMGVKSLPNDGQGHHYQHQLLPLDDWEAEDREQQQQQNPERRWTMNNSIMLADTGESGSKRHSSSNPPSAAGNLFGSSTMPGLRSTPTPVKPILKRTNGNGGSGGSFSNTIIVPTSSATYNSIAAGGGGVQKQNRRDILQQLRMRPETLNQESFTRPSSHRNPPNPNWLTERSDTPQFPVQEQDSQQQQPPAPYHPLLYRSDEQQQPERMALQPLVKAQTLPTVAGQGSGGDMNRFSRIGAPSPHSMYGGGGNNNGSGFSRRTSLTSFDAAVEVIHHHPVFVKDTSRYWYKPTISREEAIAMLKNKPPGTFVVRDSNSFPGAFGLALKVAQPPAGVTPTDGSELVRHFLIEPSSKGVRLKGCSNEPVFGTLAALVYQHSITPLALPYRLILPDYDPATGPEHINSNQALLERGAACNVTYLCSVDTESLTGPEAVRRSTAFAFELLLRRELRAVPVHFKVSSQGITLTDNTRSLFFRRHYPVNSVTFAGIDPESRVFDNNNVGQLPPTYVRQAPVFGFVARKNHSGALNGGSVENACHIFAELDPDQPASAVVRFVSNVMMPAARMHQQQQNAIAITH